MKSKRETIREKRKRQRLITRLIWIGVGVIVLAGLGYILWLAFRPSAGESVPVMADSSHVPETQDPGPYNTDPPTSGPHYANTFNAGLYDEAEVATLPEHPEGYLVHNLEHGYVIFWYNCNLLSEADCSNLKSQIRSVMNDFDGVKVIAFPWDSIDVPLVMTSWGKMQKFEDFNPEQAKTFVERNRNRSPEPNAP